MSPTYCARPFFSVSTDTDGAAKLCCSSAPITKENGEPFMFGHDSLQAIWQSSFLQSVRTQMLNGERPKACSVCWREEAAGRRSHRQDSNAGFAQSVYVDEPGLSAPLPLHMELRPGNVCNLRCLSCDPKYSSALGLELAHIKDPSWRAEMKYSACGERYEKWVSGPTYRESLLALLPTLEEINITGGEWLFVERQMRLLELCVTSGHAGHIRLSYFTNCTTFPSDLVPMFAKFPLVRINLSIDDVRLRQEYLRYPSQWPRIVSNVRRYAGIGETVKLNFHPTYSALNIATIDQYLEFIADLGREFPQLSPSCHGQILHTPRWMSLAVLPPEMRQEVVAKIERAQEKHAFWAREISNEILRRLHEDPWLAEEAGLLKKAVTKFDLHRGTDFALAFPDISKAL